jgi:hypothetical protein
MRVAPQGRRSAVRQLADGIEIVIPAGRSVFLMVFLGVWMAGWLFGAVPAASWLLSGQEDASMLLLGAWLVMWAIGGVAVLLSWLWMARGREMVTLRPDTLEIKRDVLGWGTTREYDLAYVRNLRVSQQGFNPKRPFELSGMGGGSIAFDYGARTLRFASSLDEAEAQQVVSELVSCNAALAGPRSSWS